MKFYEIAVRLKCLLEMADNRKDAIRYLRDQAIPYTTHICKYILWASQNKDWEDDWSDEIYTFLNNVTRRWIKGNKRLKEKDYLQHFFFKDLEAEWELQVRLNSVVKEYTQRYHYPKPNEVNISKIFTKYKQFVEEIKSEVVNDELNYDKVRQTCKILM